MTAPRMPYRTIAPEALEARLSILGYVKVGGKSDRVRWSNGRPWVAPMRYTEPARFVITTREKRIDVVTNPQNKNDRRKIDLGYIRDEAFHAQLGEEKPSRLKLRLMFPTVEHNFVSHFAAHDGKRWVCQGNGVEGRDLVRGAVACTCSRLKQYDGDFEPGRYAELGKNDGPDKLIPCKPRGLLSVYLDGDPFGAFRLYKTTSFESIANLRTQLQLFEGQFGRLDGLPLELVVYPASKSYGEGITTQPIVTVVLAASFDDARRIGAAAAETSRQFLLQAGGGQLEDEHREVLAAEMEVEKIEEGEEFHETAKPKPGPSLQERLDAKREAREITVSSETAANADATADAGPDVEIVQEGEEESEEATQPEREAWEVPEPASLHKAGLEDVHATYVTALAETVPGWSDFDAAAWQESKIGQASTAAWDAGDFRMATMLLRKGVTEEQGKRP